MNKCTFGTNYCYVYEAAHTRAQVRLVVWGFGALARLMGCGLGALASLVGWVMRVVACRVICCLGAVARLMGLGSSCSFS